MNLVELELRSSDLFSNGKVFVLDNDEVLLLRETLQLPGTITDKYHRVRKTDRLDVLAWKYYGSVVPDASKYWWVIADANEVMNPLDISEFVGKEILIPNISKVLLGI